VAEFCDGFEAMRDDFQEIEATVKAAGSYVRASDDLRPRVLETARMQRGERRAQRSLRRAAFLFAALTMTSATVRTEFDAPAGIHRAGWLAGDAGAPFWDAAEVASHGGNFSWNLVESFTQLRRRQAEAFNLTP
jgi:hypothetical protein